VQLTKRSNIRLWGQISFLRLRAIHNEVSRRRSFAVAPLHERRNAPVTDWRYSLGRPPTDCALYNLLNRSLHCRITGGGRNFQCRRWLLLSLIWVLFGKPALAQNAPSATPKTVSPPPFVTSNTDFIPVPVLEKRLGQFQGTNLDRESRLRTIFSQAGCSKTNLTTVGIGRDQPPDVVCRLPGISPSEIIVGGHFDYVSRGQGVVDDWSGASLLPTLFQSFSKTPPRHTFLFIGFSNEEKGLIGSRYYVSHLSWKQQSRIRAMVNLECLGLNVAEVWAHHANPLLLRKLFLTARTLGFTLPIVNVERVGTDDAESFRRRHLPTITIHSLTQKTLGIIHSRKDQMSAINMGYYNENYRLVAAYLMVLDQTMN